ncbi:hypothetical protein P3X46_022659 [Hevea brasiliensis]|uniref:Heptahelical transmembrane protein 2-like n=1 Tax=Hevea brasiliensis TaxID=3981 RepID=A0ABQ9L8G7_HEVBR|nr:heptahelical transmembrane protein 2 [Hevea brasiliensis]KAJ9162923.1 hypothetical protein P3X46_022659 [Hevea brasiliensis]
MKNTKKKLVDREKAEKVMSTSTMRKTTKKKEKFERRLVKYKDLPEYLQDNECILDYYRCEWPVKDAFLSVFSLHNESLNVWTHLGGFLIFLGLTVMSCVETTELGGFINGFSRRKVSQSLMVMNRPEFNVSDNHVLNDVHLRRISQESIFHMHKQDGFETIPRWPWFVFLSGAMGCLVCSTLSHLLACHSKRFNIFFWRLDYAGISLMIVCSFFAPIYYVFYCNPIARFFYITTISVLGILAIITLLAPALSSPRYRSFRATLFFIIGISGVIPAAHAVSVHWGNSQIYASLGLEILMAVLYAAGVAFYVTRVPERWKPGTFDIAGHSHQIFHVFVVLAALAHAAAILVIMDFRWKSPACSC